MKINSSEGAEKESAGNEKALHLARANKAIDMLCTDTLHAKNDATTQALHTPLLRTTIIFYKRKLWCFNLGIHIKHDNSGNMYIWPEIEGQRGGGRNHMAFQTLCGISFYILTPVSARIKVSAITYLMSLIHNDRFDTIRRLCVVSGHTYMPCDHDFVLIEAEKRRRQYVYTPEDWIDVIQKSRRRNPSKVYKMNRSDFLSFECFTNKLQKRTTTMDGDKVELRKLSQLNFKEEYPTKFEMKLCYSELESVRYVDVTRSTRGRPTKAAASNKVLAGIILPQKYISDVPIKPAKFRDLLSLPCHVPPVNHVYYNSLVSAQSMSSLTEEDSEDDIMDYTD
ncbi:hypothetical protein PR048_005746 [Dryococelus australis]|uniref:Uncharacterized protein n=1 Tax=Dryococelus australis TaxID=614101 RepID=A0ABQ9I926_9NEOP|nr:hypothetical protein PR048_005746 [Dryococelus australis]